MNDINFDITKHWLPVGEKQGSIEKDTLRIKVSGITAVPFRNHGA